MALAAAQESSDLSLNQLVPGQQAVITGYDFADALLVQRLASMGMIPGRNLKVLRTSLFRDPISVEVMGYNLALRASEASVVKVQLV
jgi:Fe2+ transport system protein FeoA